MSNSISSPFGSPVGRSIVPGANDGGFKIPTSEPAGQAGGQDPASGPAATHGQQTGALVGGQGVQNRASASETLTLGQRYDEEAKKGGLDRYASLFASYFPS